MDQIDALAPLALLDRGSLERTSPLALHAQVRRLLMGAIAAWPSPELRFPTERELSLRFGVSRMTLRRAMDELVTRGHLRRRPGTGTFVAFRQMEERFTPAMDFLDQWARHGRAISFRLLRYGQRVAPGPEAAALDLPAGGRALVIERLRLVGTIPVSLDLRVVPPTLAHALPRRLAASGSLLNGLRGAATLSRATMEIEARAADAGVAAALEVSPGDPLLFRRLLYRDADGRAVMAGHSFYRADQSRYVVDIPISAAQPGAAR